MFEERAGQPYPKNMAKGQSLAEYGLITALIAVVSIASLTYLGSTVGSGMNSISGSLSSALGVGGGGATSLSNDIAAIPAPNPVVSTSDPVPETLSAPVDSPTTSPSTSEANTSSTPTPTVTPPVTQTSTTPSTPVTSTPVTSQPTVSTAVEPSTPVLAQTTPTPVDTNTSTSSVPGFTSINGCNNSSVCTSGTTSTITPWGW